LPLKTEDKLKNLVLEINSTMKSLTEQTLKSVKMRRRMATIQIVLMTSTTILLGLKLGQVGQSIAFVFSAMATGLSSWYNMEVNRKKQVGVINYLYKLGTLASEVLFYTINFDPLEEEKFLEYTKMYYDLRKEFAESISILLNGNSIKEDSKLNN
jgi:hypothetical protein